MDNSKLFLILSFFISVCTAHGSTDPSIQWKTLDTAHFEIIFDSKMERLAIEYGIQAERAFTLTSSIFREAPDKTVVWITDHTDVSNGSATPFPRPSIVVYPVLPTVLDSIGHYDKWSQELITHEYIHILNMEPANGFLTPFRWLLGSIVRPNALLPRWYLEGLAVEFESHYTKKGRLRSPHYEASIRAMVRDGTWFRDSFSRINETSVPEFPWGNRPYFFGSILLHEANAQKNLSAFGDLNDRYSRRVPFFINSPAEDEFGKDYPTLFSDIRTKLHAKASAQLAELSTVKSPKPEPLAVVGIAQHSPAVSPDGEFLLFTNANADSDNELRLASRGSDSKFDVVNSIIVDSGKQINRGFWSHDSKSLIFDKVDTWKDYYMYSDLYIYDLPSKAIRRLTNGARAFEPALDPSGKLAAFVQNIPGSTVLSVIATSEPFEQHIIYSPPAGNRISRPLFLSHNEILFVERNENGIESLSSVKFDEKFLAQAAPTRLFPDHTGIQAPALAGFELLFVSEKSGIKNVWMTDSSLKKATPITNSLTQIGTVGWDNKDKRLYFSEATGSGARIYSQELPNYNIALMAPKEPIITQNFVQHDEPTINSDSFTATDYSAGKYLFPQYWIPLPYTLPGGTAITAMTGAMDPVGKHAYDVSATWDSLTTKAGYGVSYEYNHGTTTYSLINQLTQDYFYGLKLTTPSSATYALVSFLPPWLPDEWSASVGWSYLSRELPGPVLATRSGPRITLNYSDYSQKATQISPEKGGTVNISHQHFFRDLGTIEYPITDLGARWYWSQFTPTHHVLMSGFQSTWSPRNRSLLLGASGGGDYTFSFVSTGHTARGYAVGEFLGWNMVSATLEYRFPLSERYEGWETLPAFLRRWHGALFVDGISLEGRYYSLESEKLVDTALGRIFPSYGIEARADTTIAYHLPITFRIGLHYGAVTDAYGGGSLFIGMILPKF